MTIVSSDSSDSSADAVEKLRNRFLETEIQIHPDEYHPIDIERIRHEDWSVKRFLIASNWNENQAFDSMRESYRWRQKFGLHNRSDQSFPREFWQLSGVEIIKTIDGQFVIVEVLRYQKKFNQLQQLQLEFIGHCLEKIDRQSGENGFIALKDLTDARHHNVNFDLIEFQMIVSDYFPGGLKQIWLVNCPWIVRPFLPIVVNFLYPKFRQLIQYLELKNVRQLFEPENLPKTLGGSRATAIDGDEQQSSMVKIENTKPLAYMANELGFDQELINLIYKFFNIQLPPPLSSTTID